MNELIDTTTDANKTDDMSALHAIAKFDPVNAEQIAPDPQETVRDNFVSAMRRAVTGVNLVTTDGPAGRFGLTVSAMCSVSADPPTVLACIQRSNPLRTALLRNQVFCINVLSTRQHGLAKIFAGFTDTSDAYDFGAACWATGDTNAPRLIDAVANFDCRLEHAHEAGSHTVFIGRVTNALHGSGQPLLYTDRHYGLPLTWD